MRAFTCMAWKNFSTVYLEHAECAFAYCIREAREARKIQREKWRNARGEGGEGGEGRTRESKSHFKAEFSLSLAPPFPLLPLPPFPPSLAGRIPAAEF